MEVKPMGQSKTNILAELRKQWPNLRPKVEPDNSSEVQNALECFDKHLGDGDAKDTSNASSALSVDAQTLQVAPQSPDTSTENLPMEPAKSMPADVDASQDMAHHLNMAASGNVAVFYEINETTLRMKFPDGATYNTKVKPVLDLRMLGFKFEKDAGVWSTSLPAPEVARKKLSEINTKLRELGFDVRVSENNTLKEGK